MKVYGFPGQGAQKRGMGKELFARFPDQVAVADSVLGYSVERLCVADPDRELRQTQFTQPALFAVSALGYLARAEEDPVPPGFLIGHSLGEYVALFAAGVFDFETGVRLVARRGELMAQAAGGGMAAVIGCPLETVLEVLAECGLDALDIANYNAPDQHVLAGPDQELNRAAAEFRRRKLRWAALNVSAPFHSRYMAPVATEFGRALDEVTFHAPSVPVVANANARPYDATRIKETLASQLTSPVRWVETVRFLQDEGDFDFVELGPGQVLTKLVRGMRPPVVSPPPSVETIGATTFRERYGLRHAYVAGSMYGGISGPDLVVSLARWGGLAFLGTGGMSLSAVERNVRATTEALGAGALVGANLLHRPGRPDLELELVDLLLGLGVRVIEAADFVRPTPALVKFRLRGGHVLAKVARLDDAEMFLAPSPPDLVRRLVDEGQVTVEEAERGATPLASDLCIETQGVRLSTPAAAVLLPAVRKARDLVCAGSPPNQRIHVGIAGGIGTPDAAAAAFGLGAEFILTGSINQCSVEAATSEQVKDLLQATDLDDVEACPWARTFDTGDYVSVVKRGQLAPSFAHSAYQLATLSERFPAMTTAAKSQLAELVAEQGGGADRSNGAGPVGAGPVEATVREALDRAFVLGISGAAGHRPDYLVPCGSAMGAFNRWARTVGLESWRARSVARIADELWTGCAAILSPR